MSVGQERPDRACNPFGLDSTPQRGFVPECTQKSQEFRNVPLPPVLPLFSRRSRELARQQLEDLIDAWRNHMVLNLFPMLEPLDLWLDAT